MSDSEEEPKEDEEPTPPEEEKPSDAPEDEFKAIKVSGNIELPEDMVMEQPGPNPNALRSEGPSQDVTPITPVEAVEEPTPGAFSRFFRRLFGKKKPT